MTEKIEWKRISDSLPQDGVECLLYNKDKKTVIGPMRHDRSLGGWWDHRDDYILESEFPTHWCIFTRPDQD